MQCYLYDPVCECPGECVAIELFHLSSRRTQVLACYVIDHLNSYFFERRTAKIQEYPSSAIGKAANRSIQPPA